ncbi:hypothetical protein E5676_scaffold250G001090 [Cucumis melo var. makuwa]|uniref:Uncharacterized protein n=2 Tax=Cucumis melo TaxID=3656 RepID=A0A5D3DK92_CUCMM|nr:hypothetical protein E5676_scaffold250G001090 [Cucumis melo var. makuwa]
MGLDRHSAFDFSIIRLNSKEMPRSWELVFKLRSTRTSQSSGQKPPFQWSAAEQRNRELKGPLSIGGSKFSGERAVVRVASGKGQVAIAYLLT